MNVHRLYPSHELIQRGCNTITFVIGDPTDTHIPNTDVRIDILSHESKYLSMIAARVYWSQMVLGGYHK